MDAGILRTTVSLVTPQLVLLSLVGSIIGGYLVSLASLHLWRRDIPLAGTKAWYEPRWIANYRFFKNSSNVVNDGYKRFKGQVYRFVRNDADMIVLPPQYIDEMNELPASVSNPTVAHAHNLFGYYTGMDLILKSNLHSRVIQSKITPNLGSLTARMEDEMNYAMTVDWPEDTSDWVAIKPYHTLLHMVARISARIFLGLPHCRDDRWLEISTQFTETIFVSVVFMRLLPAWMLGFVKYLLPSIYKGWGYVRKSQDLLIPEIKRRQQLMESEEWGKDTEQASTLLSWMMEEAEPFEQDPRYLAHLEVVISLASIHTSQMNAVHVLYDLAAYPEYLEEIREEIIEVAKGPDGWNKTSYSKLRKLDSFLRESQRISPPSVLSFHRVMMEPHVLRDGTFLPAGAHICMATNAIQNDPEVTEKPEEFDGFRSFKKRQLPGEGHRHQFATTERKILNFGHGKYSCPGRFFASLEIKVILVKLIMAYDFKFKTGDGIEHRPKNLRAHEFIFPNPDGEILVRRRAVPQSPY